MLPYASFVVAKRKQIGVEINTDATIDLYLLYSARSVGKKLLKVL